MSDDGTSAHAPTVPAARPEPDDQLTRRLRAAPLRPRRGDDLRAEGAIAGEGARVSPSPSPIVEWGSQNELNADARRLRVAAGLALVLWLSFIGADWLLVTYRYPQPRLPLLVFRAVGIGVLIGPYVLGLGKPRTVRGMNVLSGVMCAGIAGLIGLLAAHLGGVYSPYAIGAAFPLVALAMLQRHWRNALVPTILTGLAYPAGLALGLGDAAVSMTGPDGLVFVAGTALMVGLAGFTLALSHQGWTLRQQIFESRSIGRYKLSRRLGKGGMGEVWAAFHATLKRDVALKIIRPERITPDLIARFEREVRATSALSHPNTVRVFDYGVTDDGLWYYAMELLDGLNLTSLVRNEGALPAARVVYLVIQAARALGEAHRAGIVHRDIKPDNLLVTRAGGELDFLKVIDFGIARQIDELGMTDAGQVVGSPQYIAPEVARGELADARADVYALGGVLYFLLTGRPPFDGDNAAQLLLAHMNQPVVPPSALGIEVPADLERVVLACMAKDPAHRPATGEVLAVALAEVALAGTWHPERPVPPPAREASDQPIALVTDEPADEGTFERALMAARPAAPPQGRRRVREALAGVLGVQAPLPTLDGYTIERQIGAGGMGVVYRGLELAGGRPVAIKVIDHEAQFERARFAREARVLRDLSCPGVIGYLDHGTMADGGDYLVMEWVDGEDLAVRLRGGPLELRAAIRIGVEIARALVAVHAAGVIHRDIKPSNVLLVNGRVDDVRVIDFGVARTAAPSIRLTATGVIVGTPYYMAPEQLRGEADARSDIYGLGAILFEALAGRRVFMGEHPGALMMAVESETAPSLSALHPEIPGAVDAVISRMLAKRPNDRQVDMAAVATELVQLAAELERVADGASLL